MSLKEWWVAHVPGWLNPWGPWGARGRPEMPEKHALLDKQTALNLRIDRAERLRADARWAAWREQRHER